MSASRSRFPARQMAIEARAVLASLVLALGAPSALAEGAPLSAIDWLSDTVARPVIAPPPSEPPAKPPGEVETITTVPLSDRNLDAVGILPPSVSGIDRRFWRASSVGGLAQLIQVENPDPLPALRDLFQLLMLAETDPPADADGAGAFLLTRVDKLLAMGALDAAAALVAAAGAPTPDLFRRDFDIALLLGTEDAACADLRAAPGIAPTFAARIFCLARGGDWQAAELTLRTAQALGQIPPPEEAMLERFLAPELFEDADPLPVPERISPLVLRIHEAIGEPVASTGLPLAFAHGDLTPATGWKARLEAGERLARAGAIAPGELFEIYAERKPAASGGVWARVAAVQRFETDLATGNAAALASSLPRVWAALSEVELEVAFAEIYAPALTRAKLEGEAGQLAFRIALLAPGFEVAAIERTPADDTEAFLIGLARGAASAPPPPDGLARAIALAFPASNVLPALPAASEDLVKAGRLGEAALMAIDRVTQGALGDRRGVTEGLILLRRLGLEAPARKAALQLLLLERDG